MHWKEWWYPHWLRAIVAWVASLCVCCQPKKGPTVNVAGSVASSIDLEDVSNVCKHTHTHTWFVAVANNMGDVGGLWRKHTHTHRHTEMRLYNTCVK